MSRWQILASEPRLRAPAGLFAAHLLFGWAIGVSNVLLGLAILTLLAAGPPAMRFVESARPAMRLAIAYLLLLLAAIVASFSPADSVRATSDLFNFGTFVLALLLVRGERRVRWLLDALLVMGGLLAIWGLAQFLVGYGELDRRIRGPFSHYMTFAGVLLMLDMLLVARLLERRRPVGGTGPTGWLDRRWVGWALLAAMTAALFASLTRGAWVALAVALVAVVTRRRLRLLALAPVVVAAFVVLAPVPIVARALSIADPSDLSNYDRICMAEAGLRMIGERPLLGVGPDQVERIYPLYRHPTAPRLTVPHLHNAYLQLGAERGIPALSAFVALLVTALVAAERGLRRGGSAVDLHLGTLGAIGAFAVAALFENNWGDTEVQRLALFLLTVPFCLSGDVGDETP